MAHPNPNGSAIPAAPTLSAIRQLESRSRKSTSRPTKNRNNMRPRLAAVFRTGIEAVGNMAAVNPGIRPKTEGPRRMPPMISAMTRGCLILERGKWRTRQKMMMIPACHCRELALKVRMGQDANTWTMKRVMGFEAFQVLGFAPSRIPP